MEQTSMQSFSTEFKKEGAYRVPSVSIQTSSVKLCQVGWGALLHNCFQVFPEMFDRVQVWALAGPLKDIQRLVLNPLLRCLGCVLKKNL
jgi:hypothetical protein